MSKAKIGTRNPCDRHVSVFFTKFGLGLKSWILQCLGNSQVSLICLKKNTAKEETVIWMQTLGLTHLPWLKSLQVIKLDRFEVGGFRQETTFPHGFRWPGDLVPDDLDTE